jgi:phosphoribosylformimino-5-aminoimidazole carboxamide ribotide isomerase
VELFPAIDLRGGRCVRLVEGNFDDETVYGDDPAAIARAFASAGARWIHVVDLDAALTGEPLNREVIAEIARLLGRRVNVQSGGGVRSERDAEELLESGVARVVVGTAAFETPGLLAALCSRWPGRVAAGVDHRGGEVRLRGWTEGAGVKAADAVDEAGKAGAAAVVVTDISRDGRLAGPDLAGLAELLEASAAPIVASGGVSGIGDIEALAALRSSQGRKLHGVIVGKAIYEGKVDVARAVEILEAAKL